MGGFHTVAVTNTGIMAWGCNDAGQLGTGDCHDRRQPAPVAGLGQQRVAAVACGASHTLFLCRCGPLAFELHLQLCPWLIAAGGLSWRPPGLCCHSFLCQQCA